MSREPKPEEPGTHVGELSPRGDWIWLGTSEGWIDSYNPAPAAPPPPR